MPLYTKDAIYLQTDLSLSVLPPSFQAEAKQNNGSVFRRRLLTRLQQEFKVREETRAHSLQEWVCFVTFICNIFDYLKVRAILMTLLCCLIYLFPWSNFFFVNSWTCPWWLRFILCWDSLMLFSLSESVWSWVLQVNNMPMVALVHPVYDCLLRLAQPDALLNEEEVRVLAQLWVS